LAFGERAGTFRVSEANVRSCSEATRRSSLRAWLSGKGRSPLVLSRTPISQD